MVMSISPFMILASKKAPLLFDSVAPAKTPNSVVLNKSLQNSFQETHPFVRFGATRATGSFAEGEDFNSSNHSPLSSQHYQNNAAVNLPNLDHWAPQLAGFQLDTPVAYQYEAPAWAGLNTSTPVPLEFFSLPGREPARKEASSDECVLSRHYQKIKPAKDIGNSTETAGLHKLPTGTDPSRTNILKGLTKGKQGYNESNWSSRTIRKKAKAAADAHNPAEAARLYRLAAGKEPSGNGGAKRRNAGKSAPLEAFAFTTLYKKAKAEKDAGNLAEADRLYALAAEKSPFKINRPERTKDVEGMEWSSGMQGAEGKVPKNADHSADAKRAYLLAGERAACVISKQQAAPAQSIAKPPRSRLFSPEPEVRSYLEAHSNCFSATNYPLTTGTTTDNILHRFDWGGTGSL